MSMTTTQVDYKSMYEDLRTKYWLLQDEVSTLRQFHEGQYTDTYNRMNGKIQRQRSMLNTFQRRLRGQRLHLRVINELGRGLTVEEWATAKETYPEDLAEYEITF
jgi:hypothetical protein